MSKVINVSRIDVFKGVATSPLILNVTACPCCGAAVQGFELEWEVSGLPVAAMDKCTNAKCDWAQGWDPTDLWAVQA